MSDTTVRVALHRLGFKDQMTAHGFHAPARTTIREQLGYAPNIIEAQLAHKPAGPLGEAYCRATFLTQRTVMMQACTDYPDAVVKTGEIVVAASVPEATKGQLPGRVSLIHVEEAMMV